MDDNVRILLLWIVEAIVLLSDSLNRVPLTTEVVTQVQLLHPTAPYSQLILQTIKFGASIKLFQTREFPLTEQTIVRILYNPADVLDCYVGLMMATAADYAACVQSGQPCTIEDSWEKMAGYALTHPLVSLNGATNGYRVDTQKNPCCLPSWQRPTQ